MALSIQIRNMEKRNRNNNWDEGIHFMASILAYRCLFFMDYHRKVM